MKKQLRVGRFKVLVLVLAAGMMLAGTAWADRYVTEAGGGDGSSWASPTNSIQGAIDVAIAGETVYVSNGIYNITAEIAVNKAVTVKGFNGAAVTIVQSSSGSCRIFNISVGATIDGFTIRNGSVSGYGGGVYMSDPSAQLWNCIVSNNTATIYGGGVHQTGNGCDVINCLIVNNTAGSGGGVCLDQTSAAMANCTIVGNTATTGEGGGVYCPYDNRGYVQNCIVYSNQAGSVTYKNIRRTTVTYTCTKDPVIAGTGNISSDPQLNGDYTLNSALSSPCIDAGTDATLSTDLAGNARKTDGDGNSITNVDMGAYEVPAHTGPACDFTVNPTVTSVGSSVEMSATVYNFVSSPTSYEWDMDNDGSYDVTSATSVTNCPAMNCAAATWPKPSRIWTVIAWTG